MTSVLPSASGVGSLSKSEQAYRWISERIRDHRFGPGYRLVLGSIAQELDMSTVPVREAVRRLEAEGLVIFERNIGASVALIDETEYVHTMETLGVIEGVATALSLPLLDEAVLARAEEINERMRSLVDSLDPPLFTRLNKQFHELLYRDCPNPHILDLVQRGWLRLANLRDSIFTFVPERTRHSVEEHAQIISLIRSGAPAQEIEMLVREHRHRTMAAYLAARHPDTPAPR